MKGLSQILRKLEDGKKNCPFKFVIIDNIQLVFKQVYDTKRRKGIVNSILQKISKIANEQDLHVVGKEETRQLTSSHRQARF